MADGHGAAETRRVATQADAAMNVIYRQINEQEIKEIPNASESFRKRFTSKHLDVFPGTEGRVRFAPRVLDATHRVDVDGRRRAVDLVRERRQPPPRPYDGAPEGDLAAARARCKSRPNRRQQLVESGLLAAAGTAVGLVFAWWTGAVLIAALPGDPGARALSSRSRPASDAICARGRRVDGVGIRIVPALQATRVTVTSAMKEDSGSVTGGGRQARLRRALVIATGSAFDAAARRSRIVCPQSLQPEERSIRDSEWTTLSRFPSIRRSAATTAIA